MRFLAILITAIFACACNSTQKTSHVINDQKSPQYLFVINAKSGKSDGKKLTLTGIPTVVYFSDRPHRVAGHMDLMKFVSLWNQKEFQADPPNASLSILNDEHEEAIVIELAEPMASDDALVFEYKVLQGELPKKFEESALFVDAADLSMHFTTGESPFREDFHSLTCSCGE